MSDVLTIKVGGGVEKTLASLNRIRKFPEMTARALREWGMTLERDMKLTAKERGINPFTGTLYGRGIRWSQKPNSLTGALYMQSSAILVSEMRPHYVNITRDRGTLLKWALQAKNANIRSAAARIAAKKQDKRSIYVVPHPFIRAGYDRARPKLPAIIRRNLATARTR